MRKYADTIERNVRMRRLVDEWTRSGLLSAAQQATLLADLPVEARRTNRFLRFTLGGFTLLIIGAAVILVLITIDANSDWVIGLLCLIAAGASGAAAEILIERFRLYRFGVEEACAVAAAVLLVCAVAFVAPDAYVTGGDRWLALALAVGAAAAFIVYRRYGYVYAAVGGMIAIGVAPFELGLPDPLERTIAAVALGACFAAARTRRRHHLDEYPGDEYGGIQAAAFLGIYAVLNLHLGLGWFAPVSSRGFNWLTYAVIWILPAAGLRLAIRDKDRPLLDASLVTALATLITNKPYLGLERKPWDPILLGVLLIGVAVVLKRWLAGGPDRLRGGFTAEPALRAEKELLARVATASTVYQPGQAPQPVPSPRPDPFEGGGGRSGGGGAGAGF